MLLIKFIDRSDRREAVTKIINLCFVKFVVCNKHTHNTMGRIQRLSILSVQYKHQLLTYQVPNAHGCCCSCSLCRLSLTASPTHLPLCYAFSTCPFPYPPPPSLSLFSFLAASSPFLMSCLVSMDVQKVSKDYS